MDPTLEARAKEIVGEAIDLGGFERVSLLDRRCADDHRLKTRVAVLLEAIERDDGFLDAPAPDWHELWNTDDAGPDHSEDQVGRSIGPYRLVQLVGEGGFGVVYLAEQTHPVRRSVALKIIKPGMDSRGVVARFEQERQSLAMMDHPNIARVLDAAATPDGRPYFVMELVRGRPITRFSDERGLTIPQRLGLFQQVCLGVQHAHTKGIIHRDIKPANVLVTEQEGDDGNGRGGRARVRIIDFGIAKAMQLVPGEATVFTEVRQLIGTPEYMSPEQAAGSADIDTRSDVYSLGVMLYEILSGATPQDPRRLRSAGLAEMQRIIRDEEPPAPSTRIDPTGEASTAVAAPRGLEPRRLAAMVRGELDWIAMRAIEKDRARRYESAGNLAADIGRYLAGRPVEAAPPSASYRLRKFARRNRVWVGAGAFAGAALLIGTGVAAWQARVASLERDAARAAAAEADRRRLETERVARFQSVQLGSIDAARMGERMRADILGAARATDAPGRLQALLSGVNFTDIALRTLDTEHFQRAIAAARREFASQPLVRAELLHSLGGAMIELGLFDGAGSPLEEAVDIRRKELGDNHRSTISAISSLGILRMSQEQTEEGTRLLVEATQRAAAALGPEDDVTLNARNNLALLRHTNGLSEDAEADFRDIRAIRLRVFGPDDPGTAKTTNNLALVLSSRGKCAEAEPLWREAIAAFERLYGKSNRVTVMARSNLAADLSRTGRFDEAESISRENLALLRAECGETHPATLQEMKRLGIELKHRKDYVQAERMERQAYEAFLATLGPEHAETVDSMMELGDILTHMGRAAEAAPLLEVALASRERRFGENSLPATLARMALGSALTRLGRFSEAERQLLETQRRMIASGHESNEAIDRGLAELYEQWDIAEPDKGHGARAVPFRDRLPPRSHE